MAFFVVLRGADAALSIPLPEAYPTRDAALAALSAALSTGALTLDAEVFVADLGAATPVLVLNAPSPVPHAGLESQPAQTDVETPIAEAPATDWSRLSSLDDDASLAAALKRAASSLEDEGIVAPASIESEPPAEQAVAEPEPEPEQAASWPWTNVEAYHEADDEPVAEALAADEPAEMAESEDLSAAEAGQSLDELLQESAPSVVSDPLGVAAAVETLPEDSEDDLSEELYGLTGGVGEAVADDAPIITSAPLEGEEAYLPRPVILGDYADVLPVTQDVDPSELEVPAAGLYETIISEAVGELLVPEASPVIEGGYEVAGELDLAAYTCQDCVYSNTCPKVGQSTPANCGSFQWKSE